MEKFNKDQIRNIAMNAHGPQKYAGNPYVDHLDDVFQQAMNNTHVMEGYFTQQKLPDNWFYIVTSLVYLHDVLEDTDITHWHLENDFGKGVADAVETLSINHSSNIDEYFEKISRDLIVSYVKLCDRLANVLYSKNNPSEKSTKLLTKYRNQHPIVEKYLRKHIELHPMLTKLDNLLN
jgi:(p)ppGpp synthase/HD superfamily hydrolase